VRVIFPFEEVIVMLLYLLFFSGCLEDYKKLHTIRGGRKGTESTHVGHTACVLCLALSTDSKFLVSTCTVTELGQVSFDLQLLQDICPTFKCNNKRVSYLVCIDSSCSHCVHAFCGESKDCGSCWYIQYLCVNVCGFIHLVLCLLF
jgi:hypothetical protein